MKDKSRHSLSLILVIAQVAFVSVIAFAFMNYQKAGITSYSAELESFKCQLGLLVSVAFFFNIVYQHKFFMKLGTV